MSPVRQIEEMLSCLSRKDLERLRDSIEVSLENHLELAPDAAAKIEQSKREIAAGQFTTR